MTFNICNEFIILMAAPTLNPDHCNIITVVKIPSKKEVGFVLNRKCNYKDRCGTNTNSSQGKGNHEINLNHL